MPGQSSRAPPRSRSPRPKAASASRSAAKAEAPLEEIDRQPPRGRRRAPPRRRRARRRSAFDRAASGGSSPRCAARRRGRRRRGASTPAAGAHRLQLRQPLGEPARHARARQLDREHVRQLVRQHHAPVEGVVGRRLRGDDAPEADARRRRWRAARPCAPRSRADRRRARTITGPCGSNAIAGDVVAVALLEVRARPPRSMARAAGGRNPEAQVRAGDRRVAGGDHLLVTG